MNKKTEQKNIQGKTRFNIADVVIIIVIVAIITALGLRIYNIFGTEKELCEVEITFRLNDISAEHISLSEKAKLYYSETNAEVGYIKNFTVSDMEEYAYNEKGEFVAAKVPGKKTVTGTIILICEKAEKGYFLDGQNFLTIGDTISLYTTTREITLEITSLKEVVAEASGNDTATAAQ